ncbi:MAG TPA: hypothetical protein ENJ86_11485 [Methylothermaceae bacterium]|nr:hypothetical protein [Methylothermaceae bacterium]
MASRLITEYRQKAKALKDHIEAAASQLLDTEDRRARLQAELKDIQENLNRQVLNDSARASLQERAEIIRHEISVLNGFSQKLPEDIRAAEVELQEAEAILKADEEVKSAGEAVKALEEKLAEHSQERDRLLLNIEKLKTRLDNLNQAIDTTRQANADLLTTNPEAKIDLSRETALQQEARAVSASLENQNDRIAALAGEIEQITEALAAKKEAGLMARARLEKARLSKELTGLKDKITLYAALNKKLGMPFKLNELFPLDSDEVNKKMNELSL